MPTAVSTGGMCACSMGTVPCAFSATPKSLLIGGSIAGTISDNKIINLPTFGMCQSLSNPQVSSATSAAGGTLTPQPCIPNIPAPWMIGSPKVLVNGMPVLDITSTAMCAYAGSISIIAPGQVQVQV